MCVLQVNRTGVNSAVHIVMPTSLLLVKATLAGYLSMGYFEAVFACNNYEV